MLGHSSPSQPTPSLVSLIEATVNVAAEADGASASVAIAAVRIIRVQRIPIPP